MTRVCASTFETIQMHALMKEHIEQSGEYWIYDEGWNDERVATSINPALNRSHAANLRLKMFGKLMSAPGEGVNAERLSDFERIIANQSQAILNLQRNYDNLAELHCKLCEALSVNRVLNVQHLRGSHIPNGEHKRA